MPWWAKALIAYVGAGALSWIWLYYEVRNAPEWVVTVSFTSAAQRRARKVGIGMPTMFEKDVTREDRIYRIDRDGPLRPPEGFPVGLEPLEPSLTEWGRKAVVIQLLDVNAIFLLDDASRGAVPVGVQDAYQVAGGSVTVTPFCRNPTAIDLSKVLLTKHNVATYYADSLEIRFFFDVVVEIRVGHWASKACEGEEGQCGMESGMEYQEMTYSGRFLVQWAPA